MAVGGDSRGAGKKAIAKAYVAGINRKEPGGADRVERATRYLASPLLMKGLTPKDWMAGPWSDPGAVATGPDC